MNPIKGMDPKEFIEIWQTSESLDEVAERTGLTRGGAGVKGTRYRKKGVPLKKFHRGIRSTHDWAQLAQYAKTLKPSKGGE